MSMTDFIKNVQKAPYNFSEDQLKMLRCSITDLYKLLKEVFDSPRKNYRPFTSVSMYKAKIEELYQSPSDYFCFKDKEVVIRIALRQGSHYSVATCGLPLDSKTFHFASSAATENERLFMAGFHFFGYFPRSDFKNCLDLYYEIVRTYVNEQSTPKSPDYFIQEKFIF